MQILDTYTKRVLRRAGYAIYAQKSYSEIQEFFMMNLEPSVMVYKKYHEYCIELCKKWCTRSHPKCTECCLSEICKRYLLDG